MQTEAGTPRQPEFDTIQLHGGQTPDSATNARAVPIYASTSFVFNDSQHGADLFGLKYAIPPIAKRASHNPHPLGLPVTSTPVSTTPPSYVDQ